MNLLAPAQAVRRLTCRLLSAVATPDLSGAFEDLGKDGLDAFTVASEQVQALPIDIVHPPINAARDSNEGEVAKGQHHGGQPLAQGVGEKVGNGSMVKAARQGGKLIEGRSKRDISDKERMMLKEFRKFTSGVNARRTWYKFGSKGELDALARNLLFYVDEMGERTLTWSVYEFAKLNHRHDGILTALGERFVHPKRLEKASRQNLCYILFGYARLEFNNTEIIEKIVDRMADPQLVYEYRKDQLLMIAAALYKMKWPNIGIRTIFAKECKVRRETRNFKMNEQVAWLLDTTGVAKSHFATRRKIVRD